MSELGWTIVGAGLWFAAGILGSHIGFLKVARFESKKVVQIWKERGIVGPALGFAGLVTIYVALTLNLEDSK